MSYLCERIDEWRGGLKWEVVKQINNNYMVTLQDIYLFVDNKIANETKLRGVYPGHEG